MEVTLRDFNVDDMNMDPKTREKLRSMHDKAQRRFSSGSQAEYREIRKLAMARFSSLEGFMGIEIKDRILRIFFNNRDSALSFPDLDFHGFSIERLLHGSNERLQTMEESSVRNVQRSKSS